MQDEDEESGSDARPLLHLSPVVSRRASGLVSGFVSSLGARATVGSDRTFEDSVVLGAAVHAEVVLAAVFPLFVAESLARWTGRSAFPGTISGLVGVGRRSVGMGMFF